jgi:rhodanese-related sulfurtransferase
MSGSWKFLSGEEFEQLMKEHHPLLIDVREPSEYARDGLSSAVNMRLTQLQRERVSELVQGHDSIVVICSQGRRSATAAERICSWVELPVYSLKHGLEGLRRLQSSPEPQACSAGFDRPRSVLFGLVHCFAALMALFYAPSWAWVNVWLGIGMVVNGAIGFCGLSVFFRRR